MPDTCVTEMACADAIPRVNPGGMSETQSPAADAIRRVGIQTVAKHCGVTYAAARKWMLTQVPAERVASIAAISGLRPHDIRPDIYGPNDTAGMELAS